MFSRLAVLKIVFKIPPTTRRYLQLWPKTPILINTSSMSLLNADWPVQAPSSLFPFKNEHYFDTSGSWNHQGFVHHKGDKESLRNTASKVAFWRVSRNPTNYCPKSMKFGYLFPWKTRGKRVSPRALLKSSKMMSKNHQSGDRRKTNFSTAIMTIIWTPLSL